MDPPSRVRSFYHSARMPNIWWCTLLEEEEEEAAAFIDLHDQSTTKTNDNQNIKK